MPELVANSAVINIAFDYLGLGGREMTVQSPFTQFYMAFTIKPLEDALVTPE